MTKKLLGTIMGVPLAVAGILTVAGNAEAATAYLGSSNRDFGTVDTDTGLFDKIGKTAQQFFDIATLDDKTGYGVTRRGKLYQINLNDASTTFIGKTRAFINGLGFDDSGNLYGSGHNKFYEINLNNGLATNLATIQGFFSSGDVAYDGSKFFATSIRGRPGDSLWSINTDGTNATKIGQIGSGNVYGLTYQDDTLYGFTSDKKILEINTSTGKGTKINDPVGQFRGNIFGAAPQKTTPTPVPEPASILGLLGVGAFGVTFLKKKQKEQV